MFAFVEKLSVPITQPLALIAQSVFGLGPIRPEYTSFQIQLNCLYIHGALAGLLGLGFGTAVKSLAPFFSSLQCFGAAAFNDG